MAMSRAVIGSTNGFDEEVLERISSNSISNIFHEEGNRVLQTEPCKHVLSNQRSDGFPIITSVFSLAPSTTEVQTENHHLNMDSQLSFAPSISKTVIPNTFNYQGKGNINPVVSSFVINNFHQNTAITVSTQTRTTDVKNENINLDFQNFLRGRYIITGSDRKLSNLMRANGTGKNRKQSESQPEVLDNKVEENATNFGSKLPSPRSSKTRNCITAEQSDLIAMCNTLNTADATNVGTMTDREERIRRLKNLLRRKEAEVEKIRFLSKKSALSATIDKIKLRLSTENDPPSYLDQK